MRPAELARDDSPEWLAWRHALSYLKESAGSYPDVLIGVPAIIAASPAARRLISSYALMNLNDATWTW